MDQNSAMDDKNFKYESITYKKEVSRTEFESNSVQSEFSYEEYASNFSHSYDGDDEVFLDPEESAGSFPITCQPRPRRISDVIDSIGEESPREIMHFPFPDFVEAPSDMPSTRISRMQSPPITPGSDVGYYSTGLSTPPLLLNYKRIWARVRSPSIDLPTPSDLPDGNSKWDDTDAQPTRESSHLSDNYVYRTTVHAYAPVDRHCSEYNMTHSSRGYAVIINNETFDSELCRSGSDLDVKALRETYELLGFEVTVHTDLKLEQINEVLRELRERDYTACDCLCVTVLTHGIERNLIYAKDYLYSADMLWLSFTPDKCPTLAGKPKIFFIQACKGQNMDGGAYLVSRTETDASAEPYKIPKMADFLVAYSSVEGYYSWRNPEHGTWFIQSLCSVMTQHHHDMDLLKMMTAVSRKVAVEFESYNEYRVERHGLKQVPSLHSTLIRDVYFRPKS